MRDQDRIAEISKALQDDFVVSLRDGSDLFAILERRDTALLALVQQWREKAQMLKRLALHNVPDGSSLGASLVNEAEGFEKCADQLERLITGEGK